MGRSITFLIDVKNWRVLIKKLNKKRPNHILELQTPCIPPDDKPTMQRYPIHIACMLGIPKQAFKAILQACPEVIYQVDDEGSTALHYILHYDECDKDVLELALDAYPQAVAMEDNFGCTPMFHAVERKIGVSVDKLAMLLKLECAVKTLTQPCLSYQERWNRRRKAELIPTSSSHPKNHSRNSTRTIYNSLRNDQAHDMMDNDHTTPLYIIWDVAMNTQSSIRFFMRFRPNKLKKREKKKMGKRLQKAQLMLEVAYLQQPINLLEFQRRIAEINRMKLLINFKTSRRNNHNASIRSASIDDAAHFAALHDAMEEDGDSSPQRRYFRNRGSMRYNHSSRDIGSDDRNGRRRRFRLPSRKKNKNSRTRRASMNNAIQDFDSNQNVESRRQHLKSSKKKGASLTELYDFEYDTHSRRHFSTMRKSNSFHNVVTIKRGGNQFRVLHAVLTLYKYLPDAAYDFAMVHYKHQVQETEEQSGNLPLHIACYMSKNSDFDRDSVVLELLQLNRNAAKTANFTGQLPLHIALSNDDMWSFESIHGIIDANADACYDIDEEKQLYPFQLAAVRKKNCDEITKASNIDQLSTIFTLLREAPTVIKHRLK